jgi:DNA-binding MarR family transcriptional regulator
VIVFAVIGNGNGTDVSNIEHLPPSAKLVYMILKPNRQMTQKDIIRETYLPARTVRYALSRLKEKKVLIERLYFVDARQSLYGLNRAGPEMIRQT